MSISSATTQELQNAMEVVRTKYIQEGSLEGKKVKPTDDLCERFEVFENMLTQIGPETDKGVIKDGLQMLANVRSHFFIKEKDATTGKIARAFWGIIGWFTGTKYVYIKGGPVDIETLKKRVGMTALPVLVDESVKELNLTGPLVQEAEKDKLYTFVQQEGKFYLQGATKKIPIDVTEKGLSFPFESERLTFKSLEELKEWLTSKGYLDASTVKQEIEQIKGAFSQIKRFSNLEEAKKELSDHALLLDSNESIVGVVVQNDMPVTLISIACNGEGKLDAPKILNINHSTMNQIQGDIGKDGLLDFEKIRKDEGLNQIYWNDEGFIRLAGFHAQQFSEVTMDPKADPILQNKEGIQHQIETIGAENAQNVCLFVWDQDLKGGKVYQWTGKKEPSHEVTVRLDAFPGKLTVGGTQYHDIEQLLQSADFQKPILSSAELQERVKEYADFVSAIKKELNTSQSVAGKMLGGIKDFLSYTMGARPNLSVTILEKSEEIHFVYDNGWKVSAAGHQDTTIKGLLSRFKIMA